MAVIKVSAKRNRDNIEVLSWENVTEADTCNEYQPRGIDGAIASVQVTGTFGGTTVTLAGSNDETNFIGLKDVAGDAISMTQGGLADFSTAALDIRPVVTGGTGVDVTITVVLRG